MKKIVFSALLFIFGIFAFGQIPQYYNSNTGAYNNAFPFMMMDGKAVNWLFAPGELNQPVPLPAGNSIFNIYFRLQTGGTNNYNSLMVLMAQSAIITLPWTTFYAGPWDTVYNHVNVALTGVDGGWVGINLDHPFPYDPTKSLIVFVGQCGTVNCCNLIIWQSISTSVRRCWSVSGCPYSVYGGDAMVVDFGVDVTDTPLPIELILFNGVCKDNHVNLEWATASETNNEYFIIEKSNDNAKWKFVKRIRGAGNSNQRVDYFATDYYTGDNYYRLLEVDYDGNKNSFPSIFVQCITSPPPISIYPNPTSDFLHINTNFSNILEVKIFEYDGKLVYLGKDSVINMENYASGMYLIKIMTEDGAVFSEKIIKD